MYFLTFLVEHSTKSAIGWPSILHLRIRNAYCVSIIKREGTIMEFAVSENSNSINSYFLIIVNIEMNYCRAVGDSVEESAEFQCD
jgi:hypothetical protein